MKLGAFILGSFKKYLFYFKSSNFRAFFLPVKSTVLFKSPAHSFHLATGPVLIFTEIINKCSYKT